MSLYLVTLRSCVNNQDYSAFPVFFKSRILFQQYDNLSLRLCFLFFVSMFPFNMQLQIIEYVYQMVEYIY